jgi:hypothetical protein
MKRPLTIFLLLLMAACSSQTSTPSVTPTAIPPLPEIPTATPRVETPIPTEIPIPEGLTTVPDGYSAVHNPDGTWGYGVGTGTEVSPLPNLTVDAAGAHFSLNGTTIDIPTSEIQGRIKVVQTGALLVDTGERIDYIWKGDKWAEILLQIKFETDGTKFSEFPTINYEDISSGALVEAELLEAKPFPEDVKPVDNYYYEPSIGFISHNLDRSTGIEFSLHPEKYPMRFIYFYQVTINGIPVEMATLQVLNKDYSSVFIHMVESRNFLDSQWNWWANNIQLRRHPLFDMAVGGTEYDHCKDGWSEAAKQVCSLNTPQKTVLETAMQEWIMEQEIPEELERVLFVLSSGRWY